MEKMPGHPRLYRRGAIYCHRAGMPVDIADTYPQAAEAGAVFPPGCCLVRSHLPVCPLAGTTRMGRLPQHAWVLPKRGRLHRGMPFCPFSPYRLEILE